MSEPGSVLKVVYDCNVFLQYLLNPEGPSGRCVRLALNHAVELYLSQSVLDELNELPEKPICLENHVSADVVAAFTERLLVAGRFVHPVVERFLHPIDVDDSGYINLALMVGAKLVVSRDRHLLNLTNPAKPWSAEFRSMYPDFVVETPETFLARVGTTGG